MAFKGGGNKPKTIPDSPISFSTEDGVELWDRQPGEAEIWYKRFLLYLNLEGMRSVRRAYHAQYLLKHSKEKDSNQANKEWYFAHRNYRWSERASAYDKHKFLEIEALKESRRFTISEKEWEIAQELINKASDLLPNVQAARLDAIVQALTEADKLMRSSADMFDGDLNAAINLIKKSGYHVVDPTLVTEEFEDYFNE